jgi:ubiquinone/menaquinone biosynthesis C-methylase UbiE
MKNYSSAALATQAGLGSVSQKFCYGLAMAFLQTPLRRFGFRTPAITRFDSSEVYIADRVTDTSAYAQLFQRFTPFEGKTVLDLGCNTGYLLHSFLQSERFTAIGADIVHSYLELARESYGDTIKFVQTTPSNIPLSDDSVDVVYTIDTVEHLSRAEEIFREVFRLLRPGGLFLVHFNPWLNPYGSHLEDIIAFPWPHVVFSMDTLLTVAAKVYDSPAYPTACYFLDPKTGEKSPNPYHNRENWETYLNRMTIRRFNRLLKKLPFEQIHQERIGFGGKTFKLSRLVRGLAQVPLMDELFTSALFTVLVKPRTGRA